MAQAYFDHICLKMAVRVAASASALASLHSNLGATSRILGFNSTAILFRTDLSLELNFFALFPSIDGFYDVVKVCNSRWSVGVAVEEKDRRRATS